MSDQNSQPLERSNELFKRACLIMPGGVNSPVRAFSSVGGIPRFIAKAKGSKVWDADGNQYIDFVGSWGTAILGHSPHSVVEAIKDQVGRGTSFGAPTEIETLLGEKISSLIPSIEMLRLVSSGTEACMSALRLARAYTGKDKVIKFSGCYHGHSDMMLVQAGSGVATLGIPGSPGVPQEVVGQTLVAPFNDEESVGDLFSKYPNQIAAVIIEPFVGNGGFIRPNPSFLQHLERLCQETQALLIFDEVMTGFRIDLGGAQAYLGIKPDLTTLGKIIGGGLPVGAYGGRKDIMSMIAPSGPVYQAGTLSGNPLAVRAGLETLSTLEAESYHYLHELSARLVKGLQQQADARKIPFSTDHQGGMFGFFFQAGPIKSFEEAQTADLKRFQIFFQKMLEKGIYFAPSPFEAGFLSLAHTADDIDVTIASAAEVFDELVTQ